ncbi:hypothetical protein Salat_0859500 [Sesamum alatum]|uniref:Uncharacterized protein n=1 Tax=Sesamum alatum TaxID=300844 RepID=A0AAE1YIS6_9LAMI|nr:hypothetical protein Salat_0859500 [Sesamum alatum]
MTLLERIGQVDLASERCELGSSGQWLDLVEGVPTSRRVQAWAVARPRARLATGQSLPKSRQWLNLGECGSRARPSTLVRPGRARLERGRATGLTWFVPSLHKAPGQAGLAQVEEVGQPRALARLAQGALGESALHHACWVLNLG